MGALLGLSLLKFGNPVILDQLVDKPANWEEIRYQPWPILWGYCLLALVVVIGGPVTRFRTPLPGWLAWMPLSWLAWQFVAASQTIDSQLTGAVLLHFAACTVWFYLGLLALSRCRSLTWLWVGLLGGFLGVLWVGLEQHYGGLEATRRLLQEQTQTQFVSPELMARSQKDRIFGTLFYPNAFAGVLILLLPAMLVYVWEVSARLGRIPRLVLVGLLAYVAMACLVWSKSKAGWLIVLIQGLIVVHRLPLARKWRWLVVSVVVVGGLAGFLVRYSGYFRQGATSAGARFDYWRAAAQTMAQHPFLGTGPGTFGRVYAQIKPKEAEMARLVHNDYLEQG